MYLTLGDSWYCSVSVERNRKGRGQQWSDWREKIKARANPLRAGNVRTFLWNKPQGPAEISAQGEAKVNQQWGRYSWRSQSIAGSQVGWRVDPQGTRSSRRAWQSFQVTIIIGSHIFSRYVPIVFTFSTNPMIFFLLCVTLSWKTVRLS